MLLLSVAIKILFKNTADKCFHKLSRQAENIWYYYQCILIILMHTDLLDRADICDHSKHLRSDDHASMSQLVLTVFTRFVSWATTNEQDTDIISK